MATTNDDADDYTPGQLRRMDEQTARQTLTVDQYERREKILDLWEEAEETEQQFEQEAEEVVDITVQADPEDLGTTVDLFGNTLIIHISSGNDDFQDAADDLDAEFPDDTEMAEVMEFDDERRARVAGHLIRMYDAALKRWDDNEGGVYDWDELEQFQRDYILDRAWQKWDVDGLMSGWFDIAEQVYEDREEKTDVIDKFRDEGRRGNR